jgi:hypothetical protein
MPLQTSCYSGLEMKRFSVIQQTIHAALSTATAARMLDLSRRQVFRLKTAVRAKNIQGIRHGNCDRSPANAKPPSLRRQVVSIYRDDCFDFNFTHFTETLAEEFSIRLSRETIRCWLRAEDLGPKQHHSHQHRRHRERKPRFGMMLFLDGSPHPWLGPDLPKLTLILCTDDATGRPLYGVFLPQETLNACFTVLYHVFRRFGLPESLYLDKASQFTTTRHGGIHSFQRDDKPTHFEVAMQALAVELIFANSPQARGRGERINGSFQGRLVAELRRAGINYLNQTFIPKYVRRFAVQPKDPASAFRPVSKDIDLRTVLCAHHRRAVDNDNTITLQGIRYQLLPSRYTIRLAATEVDVQEWFDGSIHVFHPRAGEIQNRCLGRYITTRQRTPSIPYDISALQRV